MNVTPLYTPGDEYRRPMVNVQRHRGWRRWRWSVCIENRITIDGYALTMRRASRRAHRLIERHLRVIPR